MLAQRFCLETLGCKVMKRENGICYFLSQTVLFQEKQYDLFCKAVISLSTAASVAKCILMMSASSFYTELHLHLQILHIYNFKKLKDRILTETVKGATHTTFLTLTAFYGLLLHQKPTLPTAVG